jgi:hypothetical protein
MYLAIRRFEGVEGRLNDLIPDGRRLASHLSREDGFVAYALLEAGRAAVISVCVFEDEAGLMEAGRLIETWREEHGLVAPDGTPESGAGEVIVQRGI